MGKKEVCFVRKNKHNCKEPNFSAGLQKKPMVFAMEKCLLKKIQTNGLKSYLTIMKCHVDERCLYKRRT